MALFHGCVAVDWSASSRPVRCANSVWLAILYWGEGPPVLENHSTREEAMDRIVRELDAANKAGHRLLCGFDFPFGFPEGTAQILTKGGGWEAVWKRIDRMIKDGCRNENNRFDAAAGLNEDFDGEGPFWGLPTGWNVPGLSRRRRRDGWGETLPPRLRYAEQTVPSAQEVWKLFYRGSVGSQALMGIARLQRLRSRGDVKVWPFEVLDDDGDFHVLAEIYPSLIPPCPVNGVSNEVLDKWQVRAVAVALEQLDRAGELGQYLRAPAEMPLQVRLEEGLFLGLHDLPGFRAAAVRGCGECYRCRH